MLHSCIEYCTTVKSKVQLEGYKLITCTRRVQHQKNTVKFDSNSKFSAPPAGPLGPRRPRRFLSTSVPDLRITLKNSSRGLHRGLHKGASQ